MIEMYLIYFLQSVFIPYNSNNLTINNELNEVDRKRK